MTLKSLLARGWELKCIVSPFGSEDWIMKGWIPAGSQSQVIDQGIGTLNKRPTQLKVKINFLPCAS